MTQAERLQAYRDSQNPAAGILSHIQMLKGDKGDTGPVGPAGRNGSDGRSVVGPRGAVGPQGIPGRDGKDGIRGIDGKDGRDGKDAASLEPQTIIDAVLREMVSGKLIEIEHVNGLGEDITSLRELIKFLKAGGFRGGAGTPIPAGGAPFAETVSGTIDGSNRTFTVPTTINTAQALYLANSIYQPVVDFNTSGTTITMVTAPDASLAGTPFWMLHT